MKHRGWLDVALQVVAGAGAVFASALVVRHLSDELGLVLLVLALLYFGSRGG
jgi:hypothetical protein